MFFECPKCKRQYKLEKKVSGQFFRCICNALLAIPKSQQITNEADEDVYLEAPDGMLFPDLTNFIDLSPFTPEEEPQALEEELPSLELPSLDLPSFDDDSSLDSIDDNLIEQSNELSQVEEEELSEAQEESLKAISFKDEYQMDKRLKSALEEFSKSEDQQFIVDMLYYLLEVKNPYIRPFVEKHLNNQNPISQYFAKRIIADLDYIEGPNQKKKALARYNAESLVVPLFNQVGEAVVKLIEKAVQEGNFLATPYFMLRLLLEKDALIKCKLLQNIGLIANQIEINFISRFLDEPAAKIRLATIESLACIGGDSVIPFMIKGMVDKEHSVVIAIKKALQNADSQELSQHILDYLVKYEPKEKKGYITILADLKTSIAFRALIFLFEDLEIRNLALESCKAFEINDELKVETLTEYLNLSYIEEPFQLSVVEYLEVIDPTFSRTRLTPVNQFDDSYTALIRDSPLFIKDFAKTDNVSNAKEEAKLVVALKYNIINFIKEQLETSVAKLKSLPIYLKTKTFIANFIAEASLLCFIFVLVIGFLAKLPSISKEYSLLNQSLLMSQLKSFFIAGAIALIPSVLLGLSLALEQVRKKNFQIRLLPVLPILIAPLSLAYLLSFLNEVTAYNLSFILNCVFLGLPISSISYFTILRTCALVPDSWVKASVSLGYKPDQAIVHSYSSAIKIAIFEALTFSFIFLFVAIYLGFTGNNNLSAGAFLLSHLIYQEGWLLVASFGFFFILVVSIPLLLSTYLIPVYALFPVPNFKPKNYQEEFFNSLSLYALLFNLLGNKGSKKAKKPKKVKEPKKAKAKKEETNKEEINQEEINEKT